jgi:hypothetical protein
MPETSRKARPTPSASGVLAKTPLPHLLIYANERRLRGSFVFTDEQGEAATVVVEDGLIRKIQTRAPVAYLGRVLYELGAINEEALNDSLAELAEGGRLHGQILLAKGAITEADLEEALRDQTQRKLRHLFTLPRETTFEFLAEVDLLEAVRSDTPTVDPYPAVWRGIREFPSWEHVQNVLLRVSRSRCRLAQTATLERFELLEDELAAAQCFGLRPMTMKELLATELLGPRLAGLLVYLLVITRQVELEKLSDAEQAAASVEGHTTQPPRESSVEKVAHAAVEGSPQPVARESTRESTRVPEQAPRDGDDLYGAAVRRPSVSTPVAAIRLSQMRAAVAASGHTTTPPSALPSPPPPPSPPTSLTPPSSPPPRDAVSAVERGPASGSAMIPISTSRPPPPGGSGSYPRQISFNLRSAYDSTRRLPTASSFNEAISDLPPLSPAETALADFKRAEACFARKNYDRAEVLCRAAYDADPTNAEFVALLGALEAQKTDDRTPGPLERALTLLDQAVQLNDGCERAFFYRAQVLQKIGRVAEAVDDYRVAARLNPYNVDALREIRLFEMRSRRAPASSEEPKPPPSAGEKPGLLERFFRRI